MLVELSVAEQRHRIVLDVLENRLSVTDVANEHGISRQTLHTCLRRYTAGGPTALVDRRAKPRSCPQQMAPAAEVLLVELRRQHPRWGPTGLHFELARRGAEPLPGQTSIYRALIRNQLIEAATQRRRRTEYRRRSATGRWSSGRWAWWASTSPTRPWRRSSPALTTIPAWESMST